MHIPEDLTVQMKYCVHNSLSTTDATGSSVTTYPGYTDPYQLTDDASRKRITDYSTQFIDIGDNAYVAGGPLDLTNLQPGLCHTFALEVRNSEGSEKPFTFSLGRYTSPVSTDSFIYKDATYTDHPIVLASAIDIYSSGAIKSDTLATNTGAADNFVYSYMKEASRVDHFTYYDIDAQDTSYDIFTGTIPASGTYIIFFALEFTNLPATFYTYKGQNGTTNHYYYERSESGNSNCYKGLSFSINDVYVRT
jgi:hypothetical protein